MKSRNPVFREVLPSGARTWALAPLGDDFARVMDAERAVPLRLRALNLRDEMSHRCVLVNLAVTGELLNCKERQVRKLIAEKKLERVKTARGPMVSTKSIEEWMASGRPRKVNAIRARMTAELF